MSLIFLAGPQISVADTDPKATVLAMLEAAEAGDWETYVSFYGEQHKFRSSADRVKLVTRFRDKWGSRVIPGLREAAQVTPKISPDGTKAIFPLKKGNFILFKNDAGHWTFHL